MASVQEATQPRNPQNVREFNAMLADLGFARVSGGELTSLAQNHSRDRLVKALNTARRDPRAMTFLQNIFQQQQGVRETTGNSQRQSPSPSVSPGTERPSSGSQATLDNTQGHAPTSSAPPAKQHSQAPTSLPSRPQATPTSEEESRNRERISKHVYGRKAALCFNVDETRSGHPTISLDATDSTGPREYNWNNKISIQLTKEELPVVAAVFLGLLKKAEYSNHGPANDKGFCIEDQGGNLFIQVRAKGQGVKAVPVTPEDAFYVAQLFVRQLRKAAPWMGGMDIMSCLRMALVARKVA